MLPLLRPLTKMATSPIDVTDPVHGRHIGRVCLRPVNLERIEAPVSDLTARGQRARESYARHLALGGE